MRFEKVRVILSVPPALAIKLSFCDDEDDGDDASRDDDGTEVEDDGNLEVDPRSASTSKDMEIEEENININEVEANVDLHVVASRMIAREVALELPCAKPADCQRAKASSSEECAG